MEAGDTYSPKFLWWDPYNRLLLYAYLNTGQLKMFTENLIAVQNKILSKQVCNINKVCFENTDAQKQYQFIQG